MYPGLFGYFRRLQIDVHDPEVPLVVIIFHTEEEFEEYRAMSESVAAYYDSISNHVVIYEQSKLATIAPELAAKASISTIAHEGVHQILHNIGVQHRLSRWPTWISEGLAEYFAPTSVGRRFRWKGVGKVNDLRMSELGTYLKRPRLQPGEMVRQTIAANSLSPTGYASAWALTHFLAQRFMVPWCLRSPYQV